MADGSWKTTKVQTNVRYVPSSNERLVDCESLDLALSRAVFRSTDDATYIQHRVGTTQSYRVPWYSVTWYMQRGRDKYIQICCADVATNSTHERENNRPRKSQPREPCTATDYRLRLSAHIEHTHARIQDAHITDTLHIPLHTTHHRAPPTHLDEGISPQRTTTTDGLGSTRCALEGARVRSSIDAHLQAHLRVPRASSPDADALR